MTEEENVEEITKIRDQEVNNIKEIVQPSEAKKIEADFKSEDFIVTDFGDDNVTEVNVDFKYINLCFIIPMSIILGV